ncbi:hypothetical protein [Clostridium cibarium]|uniref:DUF4352 domain-containing protein n=1 Tax=Clostridium cibarium TaxID=2762247 RepID=A0ABR8PZ50_9CLOT|nr:hypothetical protein [Clostridium cibarium]MBD7913442.1 hypothetical protein [Clostridium cibarium]
MRKKIMLLALIALVSINLLACGSKKEELKNNEISSTEENTPKSDDTAQKEETPATNSSEAKQSTLTSLLQIGQTGIASKFAVDSSIHDANVSLTNVIRGEDAQRIVAEYNSTHNTRISPLDSDQIEYAVAEYAITLPAGFPTNEYGPNEEINAEIDGLDGEGLTYNGILFVTTTLNLNEPSEKVLKIGVPEKGRLIFTLPKGCTDYLISFGEYDGTHAYFKGK